MNHGSLGYTHSSGELSISNALLNSLSLGQDSKLYGVYYPCPEKVKEYKYVTLNHDFMLTPIPPKLWPVSARLQLFLSHRIGSINEVCKFLASNKISIIHAESTRSAHRYDTWNLHIAFPELLRKNPRLTFNRKGNYYIETKKEIDNLINQLNNSVELKQYIFALEYSTKIGGDPNSSLAYFDNYLKKQKISDPNYAFLGQAFELDLDTNKQPLFKGKRFGDILRIIERIEQKRDDSGDVFPMPVFAELDTRELNVRMVLIPPIDGKRFFTAGIEFERVGGGDSCVGIMHSISQRLFKADYNIWHSYNYSINSTQISDKGRFVFLVEDMCNANKENDPKVVDSYISEAERNLKRIITDAKTEHLDFTLLPVTPLLDHGAIKKLFELSEIERYSGLIYKDVFISYSHANKKFVHDTLLPILEKFGVRYDIDKDFLRGGINLNDEILQRILNCREMCGILSKRSIQSEWTIAERAAAWALKKIMTPIAMPGVSVPDREKNKFRIKSGSIQELKAYAKELISRRDKRNAETYWKYYRKH